MQLVSCPTDVLVQIFSNLPPFFVGELAKVCRVWKKVTEIEFLWKLYCEQAGFEKYHRKGISWKHFYKIHSGYVFRDPYSVQQMPHKTAITAFFLDTKKNDPILICADTSGTIEFRKSKNLSSGPTRSTKYEYPNINSLWWDKDRLFIRSSTSTIISNLSFGSGYESVEWISFNDRMMMCGFEDPYLYCSGCNALKRINIHTQKTDSMYLKHKVATFFEGNFYFGKKSGKISSSHNFQETPSLEKKVHDGSITALTVQNNLLFSCGDDHKIAILKRTTLTVIAQIATNITPLGIQVFEDQMFCLVKAPHSYGGGKVERYDFSQKKASGSLFNCLKKCVVTVSKYLIGP